MQMFRAPGSPNNKDPQSQPGLLSHVQSLRDRVSNENHRQFQRPVIKLGLSTVLHVPLPRLDLGVKPQSQIAASHPGESQNTAGQGVAQGISLPRGNLNPYPQRVSMIQAAEGHKLYGPPIISTGGAEQATTTRNRRGSRTRSPDEDPDWKPSKIRKKG